MATRKNVDALLEKEYFYKLRVIRKQILQPSNANFKHITLKHEIKLEFHLKFHVCNTISLKGLLRSIGTRCAIDCVILYGWTIFEFDKMLRYKRFFMKNQY